MTTKILTGTYASGYSLSPAYSSLSITATGSIGGGGLYCGATATVTNAGTIHNTSTVGVSLGILFGPSASGVVTNAASGFIEGDAAGVFSDNALALTNLGTILGGTEVVEANQGGSITNGDYGHEAALIGGGGSIKLFNTASTLANFGTIDALVLMGAGGTVTNGGVTDTSALLEGGGGIYIAGGAGAVSNFGTLTATGNSNAVNLGGGGKVTNGSVSDTRALMSASTGVLISGAGTVRNFGQIQGLGIEHGAYGVIITGAGTVTNGAALDTSASINGYTGVAIVGVGSVSNFGTIEGLALYPGYAGVSLAGGGLVTNGAGASRSALITGYEGVFAAGAATVVNSATIWGTGYHAAGVVLAGANDLLTNGQTTNGKALVEGFDAVLLAGGAQTVVNLGVLQGVGGSGCAGVVATNLFSTGALITNGSQTHPGALIDGDIGVTLSEASGTLVNFGTIVGEGGTAVAMAYAGDSLVVEAGSAFVGRVLGGDGLLLLDSGTGAISALPGSPTITVSGGMAATAFENFGTLQIGAAASFSLSGSGTIAAGQAVIDAGVLALATGKSAKVTNGGLMETTGSGLLTIAGSLINTGTLLAAGGTLIAAGSVSGNGTATIASGAMLEALSAFSESVTFSGTTGTLVLGASQGYAGSVTGFSKSGKTSLDLLDIAFGGSTTASFKGSKSGGVLTVTDGTHTANIALVGNFTGSTFVVASDGRGGTLVHDPKTAVSVFAAVGAGLGPPAAALGWRGAAPSSLSISLSEALERPA